ncbi:Rapid ALkalinization Factor [Parasponia andersonii]|uniref:Rapid ALkalinization Factor n=1 Tax=Parasponia andersonii TaxID=3476 RepID=A0A2P5A5X3_PARAD|nr:Rapid ALkalinization Factor [Parasponia andersonii]
MAICVSKGVIIGCMISSLVCAHLIEGSYAATIGYGAVGRNVAPGCSPKYPQNCGKGPSNNYQRGCEREEECRENQVPPGTGDDRDGYKVRKIDVGHNGPVHRHDDPDAAQKSGLPR